jgi:hypothetical protein
MVYKGYFTYYNEQYEQIAVSPIYLYYSRGTVLYCIQQFVLGKENIYYTNHRLGRVLSFFPSRLYWDSPTPSPADECAPPPFGSGRRGTLAGERGGGRVPVPTRGHTLWYSVNIPTW